MDISLPHNIENILRAKVAEGIFSTMDEAIMFAVQFAFVDNNISLERINQLNAEIEKGWQDMESGKGRGSKEVFSDFRKRYA